MANLPPLSSTKEAVHPLSYPQVLSPKEEEKNSQGFSIQFFDLHVPEPDRNSTMFALETDPPMCW